MMDLYIKLSTRNTRQTLIESLLLKFYPHTQWVELSTRPLG